MNCEIWEQFSQELENTQSEIITNYQSDLLTDLARQSNNYKIEVKSNLSNHLNPQVFQETKSKPSPKLSQKSRNKTTKKAKKQSTNKSVKVTKTKTKTKTNNVEKVSYVPAEEIKNQLSKILLLVAASLSTVLLSSSLVLGYKGVGQLFSPSTEKVDEVHPIDIPYITNPEQCKTNGNVWKQGQCLEYRNNPM